MPQLIPFFFFNQIFSALFVFLLVIYFLSKYVLPLYTYFAVIRTYITKLSNK